MGDIFSGLTGQFANAATAARSGGPGWGFLTPGRSNRPGSRAPRKPLTSNVIAVCADEAVSLPVRAQTRGRVGAVSCADAAADR